MQVTGITRTDPFDKLEEMLRKGNEVAQRKLEKKSGSAHEMSPAAPLPPEAADEVDMAYGAAMSLLGNGNDGGLSQHTLDPDRVAALLDL